MAQPRASFKTPKGTELPLLNLKGKEYLEVKWRLVWLREEHPDWSILTELIGNAPDHTIARAQVSTREGHILATAHKREDQKHFPDHMEKAETGAIGRALALCGYGSQFSPEIEEGDRIVDAPADARRTPPQRMDERNPPPGVPSQPASRPTPRAENTNYRAPETLEDALNFIMPFGKTKGAVLGGMAIDDVASALAWAEAKGKFEAFQAAARMVVNSANEPSSDLSKDDFPF